MRRSTNVLMIIMTYKQTKDARVCVRACVRVRARVYVCVCVCVCFFIGTEIVY